jgi:hypothetical protein
MSRRGLIHGVVHPRYQIENCGYSEPNWVYISGALGSSFQSGLERFKASLVRSVNASRSQTYLKFGDGDYYFLRGLPVGSAAPGKRAISKTLSDSVLAYYRDQAKLADFFLCEQLIPNRAMFFSTFNKQPDFPAEYVYGLVANRWLTREFSGEIGLIGSASKLRLIRSMMEYEEYRNYLGLQDFRDYVAVPDLFAADDPIESCSAVGAQLAETSSKLFLVGVGHLKSALFAKLKDYRPAVYLDVGSGIDALAGVIDTKRPYMENWKNYQLKDRDRYEDIDLLNFNHANIKILS